HGNGSGRSRTSSFQSRKSHIRGLTSASPSDIRGGSPVRESRSQGSVRGALSNGRPYRDASVPRTLRLHPGRQSFLSQVLPMVQHRTPPSRNRPDDAKPSPLRTSRRNLRRPKADPRKRFPHQPEPVREKHPLAPRQANRRLDQSAPNQA